MFIVSAPRYCPLIFFLKDLKVRKDYIIENAQPEIPVLENLSRNLGTRPRQRPYKHLMLCYSRFV